jgi:hypothetical protein
MTPKYENPMEPSHYVGLDVSQELTSLCVIDQQGIVVWRGKCATDPDAVAGATEPGLRLGCCRTF